MNKFLLLLAFSLCAEQTDILFHLHDAGETYALMPVIKQLEVDYLVIATGTAKNIVDFPPEKVRGMEDLKQIEPREVVTGVANELQGAVLDFYRNKGIPTFAYWDNFNSRGDCSYFQTAHSVERRADVLLLPSQTLAADFPGRATYVVGHPTLEVKMPSKVAVWIGGYGPEYEEAFQIFQEGKKGIDDVVFLVQHHPRTGLKNELKFHEALAIADLVVCHQSTASFQALAAKKPVLHVIPSSQTYSSLPLQKGLAKKVSCAADFADAVHEALEMDVDGFFDLMGIPENSTECCKAVLMENLQKR